MATCIVGDPGTGKTRLAGTWPDPLWLNGESDGNTTALPGLKRPKTIDITLDNSAPDVLLRHLSAIGKLEPNDSGEVEYQGMSFKSVVVDTFDSFQDIAKYSILKTRQIMEQRDWGILETKMRPILIEINNIKIPVVVIAHIKTIERGEGRFGRKSWSAQGSITTRMDRTFSEILHVVSVDNKDGISRAVICQPVILDGYQLLAKDRHQRLAKLASERGAIKLANLDGYPDDLIAKAIIGAE